MDGNQRPNQVQGQDVGSPPAIRMVDVTKQYRRVAQSHKFLTLKSAFVGGNIFKLLRPDEVFTALEGISIDVARGETFGVIGANGAGKSTLMKIIAGITKATTGEVEVRGKISALIELGAGFHPEISGRENVYINAIMLGLTRKQVEERFDDIVAFAELEEFIDAPVKHYSSGMYMRLGFSVAIHVDPDVLVIDEVLAVGDESFVHKCLDKIGEFKRRGKTILLVTHGMETVRRLCDRAAWINQGKVQAIGDPPRVIDSYLEWVAGQEEEEMSRLERDRVSGLGQGVDRSSKQPPDELGMQGGEDASVNAPYEVGRWGSGEATIDTVRLLDAVGAPRHVFTTGEPVTIEIGFSLAKVLEDFVFGIGVFSADGVSCYGTNTDIERFEPAVLEGSGVARIQIPAMNLVPGTYYLDVAIHRRDGQPYDYHRGLYSFRLHSPFGDVGVARLPHRWSFEGGVRWKREGGIPLDAGSSGEPLG